MLIDGSPAIRAATARRTRLTEWLLVPAAFVTTAGNAFQITAAAILVFRAESTTLAVGWLFIAVSVPQVALALIFGRLVDRYDRRKLCITADLVGAACAVALPLWLWMGGAATLGSYLANFLLAATTALFMPASNALIKERVADERLGKFNSHYEMATNAGMLLASAGAGFLVLAFGPTPLFMFNSLTFVASAVLTWFVGPKPAATGAPAAPDVETAPAVLTEAAPAEPAPPADLPIRRLAMLYSSGNIGTMVSNALLTVLILQTFNKGPGLLGIVDALAGVGFLIGAATYGWFAKRTRGLTLAVLGAIACNLLVLLEPLHYIALICAMPLAALCFALARISARTLLMRASPPERAGRIFGFAQASGLAMGITTTVVLSLLADAWSVPAAFWTLSAVVIAVVSVLYLSIVRAAARPATAKILEASAA
ncbi:MFS transporter [Dactylosporangium sp. NPDC048998]|uniref:MFS transporter n=1 Tax=Dactylosporangium sp. NPDC048998 TaxID=3363976 RepID=UPI00371D0886